MVYVVMPEGEEGHEGIGHRIGEKTVELPEEVKKAILQYLREELKHQDETAQ